MDAQDSIIKLDDAHQSGFEAGLDLDTGDVLDPSAAGIYDNYSVKSQYIQLATVIATKLLLVDQIIRYLSLFFFSLECLYTYPCRVYVFPSHAIFF